MCVPPFLFLAGQVRKIDFSKIPCLSVEMSDKKTKPAHQASEVGYYCSEAVDMIVKLRKEGFQGTSKEIREEAIKRVLRHIPYTNPPKD